MTIDDDTLTCLDFVTNLRMAKLLSQGAYRLEVQYKRQPETTTATADCHVAPI